MKTLHDLIIEAKETLDKMSPEEKDVMLREQRRSFVRAEAAFGSDRDEAEYAEALRAGDKEKIKQLEAESQERVQAAEKIMKERGL